MRAPLDLMAVGGTPAESTQRVAGLCTAVGLRPEQYRGSSFSRISSPAARGSASTSRARLPRTPNWSSATSRCRRSTCRDPGADPQPAGAAAARARPDLPFHLARHGGRRAHLRRHRGDVPRPDRRARAAPGLLRQPAAPVQRRADVGGAHRGRRQGAGEAAHQAQRRPAEPDRTAAGLPLCRALPGRRARMFREALPPLREVGRYRATGFAAAASRRSTASRWRRCNYHGPERIQAPHRGIDPHESHHCLSSSQDHHDEPDAAGGHARRGARRPHPRCRLARAHASVGRFRSRHALCPARS